MKKPAIVTVSLLILIITSLAFTISDKQPIYKNLKILPQDISKEKLDSIMHLFSMSLSVRCTFCHVRNEADRKWDFASDSIADKLIARKMMLMTIDINKKYFSEEEKEFHATEMAPSVTCFTCHRGAENPLRLPPPPPPRVEGQLPPNPKPEGNK